MTTLKEIEEAISRLPGEKLVELRRWFDRLDSAEWDRQFEQDVKEGKLDTLGNRALKAFEKGRCTEL